MRLSLDDDPEGDDPILSVVNLIDVFLVIIAALLLAVAANPLNAFGVDKVTVIRNPGRADMEIVTRDGKKIERFRADGGNGKGQGVRAGVAYRLEDGSMVYVPE
ncbi:MAG TPA: DUF2149 domain-containing protein [Rhodocyclaceae bacterium]|nr:DUF2149 domain-containing protein [Betaproteobacteria bacterium]HMV01051.1 DUF2149 domain-containing protein [Rhodocyclaceae bacterium]HMV20304.1 DUF2149 domain-containing protein [Rhodocyclaceae bacterium]HMW78258.1 DUF2149 domain-containing protein [Rhodocyclaceae bacterium]HNL22060.1 DUF2149 domain-containing protein [Rhodocyclaceae bacterium]